MLSLPDFREKQILFIQAEKGLENKLQFNNENVCFKKDGKIINQLSCHKIFCIFIIGDFSITTPLIKKCSKYGISLFLVQNNFEVYGALNAKSAGNYLLREKQYKQDKDQSFFVAKMLVKNKIENQFRLLREYKKIKDERKQLNKIFKKINSVKDEKQLLGVEGNMSKIYFQNIFKEFNWLRRMPRVKIDEINILLDIGYTFLFHFVDALLQLYGFDTYKGVYHKLFFQRKSLACDIMEPLRYVVDKQIVKAFHLGQIDLNDFKKMKFGVYQLSYNKQSKYMKIFFSGIMDNKEDIFKYIREYYYYNMEKTGVEMPSYPQSKNV